MPTCTAPGYKRPEIMINKTLSQMNAERLSPRKKKKATSHKRQASSALKKTQLNNRIMMLIKKGYRKTSKLGY